jgi:hypothetical protein
MARHYFSRKYYNAPMPHAIFFYYGFAIHGTNDLARLWRSRIAWLCQVASVACGGAVRIGPATGAAKYADRDIELALAFSVGASVPPMAAFRYCQTAVFTVR